MFCGAHVMSCKVMAILNILELWHAVLQAKKTWADTANRALSSEWIDRRAAVSHARL